MRMVVVFRFEVGGGGGVGWKCEMGIGNLGIWWMFDLLVGGLL